MQVLRYSDSELNYSWFIRSLTSDGLFFGDMTDKKAFQQRNFSGCFAHFCFSKLQSCLNELCSIQGLSQCDAGNAVFRFSMGNSLSDVKVKVAVQSFYTLPKPLLDAIKIIEPAIFKGLDLLPDDQWDIPLRFGLA